MPAPPAVAPAERPGLQDEHLAADGLPGSQADAGDRRFVGRHAELKALQQALQRAVAGQPGIVLLAGEPGIGKTRTAQQMIAFAAQHEVLALWGRLHCELGAHDEARQVFDALAADGFAGIANDAIRTASLAYLAEVCAWLGDAHRAPVLQELLQPYTERCIVFGAHTASLGAAARLLGLLAATLRQWDAAQRHFEFALGFDERSGGPPWLARSRCDFAHLLLQRAAPGDRERARSLAAAALDAARELGLAGIEERALALQQQLVQAAGAQPHAAGLSGRELQVLRLVAAGKTNPQIAAALHRSPATVAIHVRNILDKTRSANRAEAAAFAARHGLLAPE